MALAPRKLALHSGHATRQTQPLRQRQAEVLQQDRLGLVGAHHAAQADGAAVGRWRHDVGALDARQLFQQRRRTVAQAGEAPIGVARKQSMWMGTA